MSAPIPPLYARLPVGTRVWVDTGWQPSPMYREGVVVKDEGGQSVTLRIYVDGYGVERPEGFEHTLYKNRIREVISGPRAEEAGMSAPSVRVKPLVWRAEPAASWSRWTADHGDQNAVKVIHQPSPGAPLVLVQSDRPAEEFSTLEAAQAAAQQQWDAFILSALEPATLS